jgi:UDP-N-acetylglucosamine:LPS N-acetylglucosamine transferase
MEHCFYVEPKCFSFSAKAEASELRLEERRKRFCVFIFLGLQGSVWLMATIEEALKALMKDFVKYFWADVKALMVRGGGKQGQPLPRGGCLR